MCAFKVKVKGTDFSPYKVKVDGDKIARTPRSKKSNNSYDYSKPTMKQSYRSAMPEHAKDLQGSHSSELSAVWAQYKKGKTDHAFGIGNKKSSGKRKGSKKSKGFGF